MASRLDIGPCRIHLRDAGAGRPVLLLHGLCFDGGMWQGLEDQLVGRHRLLAPDARGHGLTEWPPPQRAIDLDDLADDAARLLDRLEIARAAVVGLSMGGMVAMRLALRHPARVLALGLLSTSAEAEEPAARASYDRINEDSRGKPAAAPVVDFVLALQFSAGFRARAPEAVAGWRQRLLSAADPDGLYQVARAVIRRDSILPRLAELAIPALVLAPAGDTAIAPARGEAIAAAIPGAELVHLPDSGHLAPIERPAEVSRILGDFLARSIR